MTTFFDLFRLRRDFPGFATRPLDPVARAEAIERSFKDEVVRAAKCRPDRFLPHIQPHEFEALTALE